MSSHKSTRQTLTTVVRCLVSLAAKERFRWLQDHAPCFGINGQNVSVLDGPQQFYDTLKNGIETAHKRVVLASLYIGEGPMERALIDSLLSRCLASKSYGKPIDVQVLLDYTRGSRGVTNSRTLLLPLLEHYRDTSQVALYHTPNLRGILRALIPERYNEVIGLSHLKVYLYDNSLIMSGANLSNDYFTNRQDRYILFKDVPNVSNFFANLVSTISNFSLQLEADNSISLHPSFQIHPFKGNFKTFKTEASKLVKSVINPNPDNTGGHLHPTQENYDLGDKITEKLTNLSKSIPSKESIMSRNFSSISQDLTKVNNTAIISGNYQEFSNTANHTKTNSEIELKLLDLLENQLTTSDNKECTVVSAPEVETNIKGSNFTGRNIVHTGDLALNNFSEKKNASTSSSKLKHTSYSKPPNSLDSSNCIYWIRNRKHPPCQDTAHNDSLCNKFNEPHQCNFTIDSERISADTGLVKPENSYQWNKNAMASDSTGNKQDTGGQSEGSQVTDGDVDTWLYPLIQMEPLGITVDQEVTEKLLKTSGEDSTCVLASGYFNLVEGYLDLITNSPAAYHILMASPQVNGFYKAKGFPGYIPDAYTFIARNFYNRMKKAGQLARVKLFEYHKDKWTFHAKGLWICINRQTLPSLVLIGSPNFGYRSVHRDLEAQLALVTENNSLQQQLHEEHVRLFSKSKPVSEATFDEPDRKEPLWVRLIVPIIKNFF
ncbi:CDP-diacylglycerol--glycerol-3-phosphate 3-phosphatidyltransferase, mitochondrial-like isoform X2 [Antedon mediterranea]